jgi:hypothetical protein
LLIITCWPGDRPPVSFLTAAIAYIAIVIGWVMGEGDGTSWIFILITLGALHHRHRHLVGAAARLGHAGIADFPGKDPALPPYGSTE